MKKSITDYLYALSEDSYDNLFEIMNGKYRKFIRIYWLLKDYSDNITFLKYKDKSDKDKLQISATFSGIDDIPSLANKMRNCIDASEEIYIETHKNTIDIDIIRCEND